MKSLILTCPAVLILTACVYVPAYESEGVTTTPEAAGAIDEPGYLYDYPAGYSDIYRYGYYLPYPLHGLYYPVLTGGRPRPAEPADPGDAAPDDQADADDTAEPRVRPRSVRPRDVMQDDRRRRARVRAAPKVSPPPATPSPSTRGSAAGQESPVVRGAPRDQR